MRDAIDYNALSWVRQELGETLKAARHHLEDYAGNKNVESLQGCVARLHEARGPLRMVNLKGADLLTSEMEEIIADLLLDSIDEPETALELLMQGFLELPEYLYALRSGRADNPAVLFPLINSLRANRGEQPLAEGAVFSPDLSARVPSTVFDVRADHPKQDITALARAARLRFQGGLLDWYRSGDVASGLQKIIDVLEHLQHSAGSEPVARLWWVSAGVAELLRDGELQSTPDIKRLFGQIDRHIKRLMDKGEGVFADVLTDDLVKNLLIHINAASVESPRNAEIRATYGLVGPAGESSSGDENSVSMAACSEELLQTVSGTVSGDIVRIKEQLDEYLQNGQSDSSVLASVADELHALANMLGMIGMDALGEVISSRELLLRNCADSSQQLGEAELVDMANTLIATEDALADINANIRNQDAGSDGDDVTFKQGRDAVISAIIDDMSSAKEAINDFLHSCGDYDLLVDVPIILNRIHGSLQLVGQERVAAVTSMTRTFIARELLAAHRELSDEDMDTLADAICSIEYCVEELAENRDYGNRAMDIAEESLEKLGYACPQADYAEEMLEETQEPAAPVASAVQAQSMPDNTSAGQAEMQATAVGDDSDITRLQVIDQNADPEIVEIFIEEAAEELDKVSVLIPQWCDDPVNQEVLTEIRRSFHTIKGSGRMVGAMAAGEFSWAIEDLVNNLLEGSVDVSQDVLNLLQQVPVALSTLLEQVKDPEVVPSPDINAIAGHAHAGCKPGTVTPGTVNTAPVFDGAVSADGAEAPVEAVMSMETAEESAESEPAIEQMEAVNAADFPVLTEAADPEIVEVFLEEAAEVFKTISVTIPVWVAKPGDRDVLNELRLSFHMLKGSGRMAGAMRIGEFCLIIETLFNKLMDDAIKQSASLFTFIGGVPEVLTQMLDQVRDGTEPELDIQEIMVQATTLANGWQLAMQVDDSFPETDMETGADVEADGRTDETGEHASTDEDEEPSLLEIFSNECREHLQTLNAWLEYYEEPGQVTDTLYRALHTLSGISESADMYAIGRLADGLYAWFGTRYDEQQTVSAEGFEVLRDCTAEITRMLDALPELVEDEAVITSLSERIAALDSTLVPAEDTAAVVVEDGVIETGETASHIEDTMADEAAPFEEAPVEEFLAEPVQDEAEPHIEDTMADEAAPFEEAPVEEFLAEPVQDEAEPHIEDTMADEAAPFEEAPVEELLAEPVQDEAEPHIEDTMADEAAPFEEAPVEEFLAEPVQDEAEPHIEDTMADEAAPFEEVPVEEFLAEPVQAEEITVDEAPESTPQDDPYAEMDPELYEIFVEEATEIMDTSESVLRDWTEAPDNHELMAEFQRHLHTLKGSARMVDLEVIGNLSHAVESVITEMAEGRIPASPELFSLLADAHDRLAEMLEQVRNRSATEPAADLEAAFNAVINGEPIPEPVTGQVEEQVQEQVEEQVHEQVQEQVHEPKTAAVEMADLEPVTGAEHEPNNVPASPASPVARSGPGRAKASPPRLVIDQDASTSVRGEQVKVQSDVLDNMVNYAGEISIYRSRMEQQISDYRFNLSELNQTISRLRDQLRQLEMETEAQILYRFEQETDQHKEGFDPLEMDRYSALQQSSRSLMESISDLRSLQEIMENTTRDSETLLLQQSRVTTELQEGLIRTRMIPFISLAPRLRRIARQSARQMDKKVDVNLIGEDGEMDRAVVERIIAPLEHMLRNSIAHGIELPRDRKTAGKPVTGVIDIEFERDGPEIVLRIADDGAGMNIDAIRNRAVERGLLAKDSDLPDQDVIQFVLQTGFSTASEVTQISGRGVGMDVVNSEVKQLGGSLQIDSETGKGATFTVRLPYTLAINQGMLVTAGDETFCVPLASVEGVVRFYPEEMRECYGDGQQLFEYGGNEYHLKHLASLLGTGVMTLPADNEQVPVLLVRVGDKRVGLHIDSLQGIREVVIKPVGPQISLVDGISGATILGDGRVVMILDMVAVARREASVQSASDNVQPMRTDDSLIVMVVDDSITVRKVTTRLLERNGYKVVTAKDGVDAMGKLQESIPDIMLLDIEMPRMDGFELATHMRNDDNTRHVPIIMITSRTGDKHRERARQIGVQSYLGKPYQEADLLESIHDIIGITPVQVEG